MRRKPETRLLVLLLAFALWFVAMLSISAFTDWGQPGTPTPTPGATICPTCEKWQERYQDEAWQQFSH